MSTLKDFIDNLPPDAEIRVTFHEPEIALPAWMKPITMTPQETKALNDQLRKLGLTKTPPTEMIVWDSIPGANA